MLRKYTSADYESVLNLLDLNTPTYFAAAEKEELIDYLKQDAAHYYVIEQAAELVACGGINYFESEKLARISWDIVHPDAQGQGLGRRLTQFRIKEIRQTNKADKIIVRTSQLVYPFYKKMGFKLNKVVKDYWAKGFDLYQMEMLLD